MFSDSRWRKAQEFARTPEMTHFIGYLLHEDTEMEDDWILIK